MGQNGFRISALDAGNAERWVRYINESPESTFFHRPEWKDIIEESFGYKSRYIMASENGKIRGILPMVHVKSPLFGSILCSMPFLNYGGVCAETREAEKFLLDEALGILKDLRGDYLELRQTRQTSAGLPHDLTKISLTLELSPDPNAVFNRFDRKHRYNIRRAEKNGFQVRRGGRELLPEFYSIMKDGWKEHGTPIYSYRFFESVGRHLHDSIRIFIISHDGIGIGTAMNGLHRDTVEGLWLSQLHRHSHLNGGYVLYWEMIRHFCESGFKKYNLGRSSVDSGGEQFKMKWNTSPRQLYWEYILNRRKELPQLHVRNPKFKFAMKVWRKLPEGLVNFIGPHLAKQIP